MAISLFVACDADTAVNTTVDRGLLSDHLFETEGKYFSTLQDAVNYLSGTKALSEKVIRLTMDAAGPGAVINDLDVVIDFDGHSYAFTDVTVKYNKDYKPGDEIEGTFGLKIIGASNVILRNLSETVTLEDHTDDLVMIFVEGSDEDESFATLAVEGEFDLTVQDTQYVFWGANRANIFFGSDFDDDPNLVMLNGKIAASGNAQGWILGRTTVRTEEIAIKDKAVIHLKTYKQDDGIIGRVEIGQIIKEGSASVHIESDAKVHVHSTQEATVVINTKPVDGSVQTDVQEAIVTDAYTITYHTNGGTITDKNNLYYIAGTGVELPVIEKTGFTFGGWFASNDFSGPRLYSVSKTEQGDKDFYAKWTNNTTESVIYYHPNESTGGTAPNSQAVKKTDTSFVLSANTGNLEREGYTFTGWNLKDDSTGTHYNASSTYTDEAGIKNDITFYADWTPNQYTVTFDPDGGTVSESTREVTYDKTYGGSSAEDLPIPVLTDNTFLGWYDAEGNRVYKYSVVKTASNHTLTAHWTETALEITFDANGGTLTINTQPVDYDVADTLYDAEYINLSKTGYSFTGWNTKSDGSGKPYANEASITVTENTTLYAQWSKNSYHVVFYPNEGTGSMSTLYFTYDETKALTQNAFTRKGYTFNGWAETSSGEPVYSDKQEVSNLSSDADGVVNLYAVWNPIQYTVIYNKNASDATGTTASSTHTYDVGKALTANGFTRTGYEFAGWTVNADGTGDYYENINSVKNLSETDGANVTLYAQWANYVGTLVKSKASGTEKYITSIFYGQKASGLLSSSVQYVFFYSDNNGILRKFYTVNASDIVDGNGNTNGSTAMEINTAIQAEIAAGRASSSSNTYYAIIIPTGSTYVKNNDAYASFYMYIPGDSSSSYNVATGSAGSSFTFRSLGLTVGRNQDDGRGIFTNQNEKDYWPDNWYFESTTDYSSYSIGGINFKTGRFRYSMLDDWINSLSSTTTPTKTEAQNKFYGTNSERSAGAYSIWFLMKSANDNANGLYHDWFIPSYGEIEQMRLSFGPLEQGITKDNKTRVHYHGVALYGEINYYEPSHGGDHEYVTITLSSNETRKWNEERTRYDYQNLAWITYTENDKGNPQSDWWPKYDRGLILVRTF